MHVETFSLLKANHLEKKTSQQDIDILIQRFMTIKAGTRVYEISKHRKPNVSKLLQYKGLEKSQKRVHDTKVCRIQHLEMIKTMYKSIWGENAR